MPLTPFHMGPGLAVKAVLGNRFSLLMFGVAQVAIDVEPGLGILLDWDVLHGWTHSYLGATAIAAGVLAAGRPLCAWILRHWNFQLRRHGLAWLVSPESIGWLPGALGAFAGTYSHVALDSIMHADMRPLSPLSATNDLLSLVSLGQLHIACAASGIVGLVLWVAAQAWARRRDRSTRE